MANNIIMTFTPNSTASTTLISNSGLFTCPSENLIVYKIFGPSFQMKKVNGVWSTTVQITSTSKAMLNGLLTALNTACPTVGSISTQVTLAPGDVANKAKQTAKGVYRTTTNKPDGTFVTTNINANATAITLNVKNPA